MTDSLTPNPLAAMTERLEQLFQERAAALAHLQSVNSQIANIAGALGMDPAALDLAAAPPERPKRKPGRIREGTMTEHALKVLGEAENGLTRVEWRDLVAQHPKFGQMIRLNPNGFYNMSRRMEDRGEAVERGNRYYLPDRAPPEEPPSSNIRSLFDGRP